MGKAANRRKRPVRPKTSVRNPNKAESEPLSKEVLEGLPDETRIAYAQAVSFQGPLPPPVLFKGYEEILPGAAERILQLAEREQEHRQGWEMSVMDAQRSNNRRGQWLGFGIAAMGIVSAVICALLDKPSIAIASLAPVVAGILASFIFRKTSSESDQP